MPTETQNDQRICYVIILSASHSPVAVMMMMLTTIQTLFEVNKIFIEIYIIVTLCIHYIVA